MHSFTFNGTASTSFSIKIEQYRDLNRPARKYNAYDVWGRNGNSYNLTDAFEEVEQSYQIFATDSSQSSVELFGDIMEWLHSADDYAELTDTYDTTHYRMAVFVDSADIANSWNKFGRMVVTFRCRPERYISNQTVSGTSISSTNATAHDAKPLIKLTGSGKESLLKPANERTGLYTRGWNFSVFRGVDGYAWDDTVYLAFYALGGTPRTTGGDNISYSLNSGSFDVTITNAIALYCGIGLPVRVLPDTNYVFTYYASGANYYALYLYDSNGIFLGYKRGQATNYEPITTVMFKTSSEAAYVVVALAPLALNTEVNFGYISFYVGTEVETVNEYGTYTGSNVAVTSDGKTKTFNISQSFDTLYIDCENEHIYSDDMSFDTYVTVTEVSDWTNPSEVTTTVISESFPCLKANSSYSITTSNDITAIELTPRFWEI